MRMFIRFVGLCLLMLAGQTLNADTNEWEFTVSPNVQNGIYHEGDFLGIYLYSERDCFFRIIHIDVNGKPQVIYPVNPKDDNFIRAGNIRLIPDNTLYRLGPPFGEEVIIADGYDKAFEFEQSSGAAPLGPEIVSGNFTMESDDDEKPAPLVTARFSFSIEEK